jgi:hypothetical protein
MTDYQKAQLAVATKKARASSLLAQMNAEPNAAKKREIAKQIQEIWPPPATPGPLDQNPFNPDDMLAAVEGVAGAAGAVPTGDATSPSIAAPTISPSSQIPTVKSQEERDALPPGTVYVGPDGKKYRKQ